MRAVRRNTRRKIDLPGASKAKKRKIVVGSSIGNDIITLPTDNFPAYCGKSTTDVENKESVGPNMSAWLGFPGHYGPEESSFIHNKDTTSQDIDVTLSQPSVSSAQLATSPSQMSSRPQVAPRRSLECTDVPGVLLTKASWRKEIS
ncbi:hypothetical protein LTR37_005189 [Vermiconidia calcicola]|uniref:Uncharacterized protein n=1 Tax=Vermiconidia calcicola TaxID=1690605 RepID=A0ACC3NKE3_9PEZI|nr:hypothetical protein LTR37_005189 [Vermiconidia calcicola]